MGKFCKYCGKEKDIDEFSKHPKTKDGRSPKCKECTSAFVRGWYRKTISTRIENEKKRSKTPERKEFRSKYQKEEREKKSLYFKARNAVNIAVRDGRIRKQPCKRCGAVKTEAHHHDYSKPLDVEWLCRPCHMAEHGKIAYELLLAVEG